nr:hypothetical protein GCM10025699_73200 [Microbacterium flavescens]
MVLADADEVESDAIGEDGLLDEVADGLGVGDQRSGAVAAGGALGDVAEGVEAELEGCDMGLLTVSLIHTFA